MSNSSISSKNVQIKVPFHGAELYVIEHNGQPFVPMKPVVDGVGLDWKSQHRKLNGQLDHSGIGRFSAIEITVQLPGDVQRRAVTCMPLRKLPGWLMSIEPGKVKDPMIRDRVVKYQHECDDALWQYWNDGIAVNPRIAFSVNPGDVLTADQQETLRLMVKTLVERLPKAKQGGAAIKIWSKLKSHFKVAYRQIPQSEFTEAVSIVTRTASEWEVVGDDPEPDGIAFVVPRYGRYLIEATALGSYVFDAAGMNLVVSSDLARMKGDMRALRDSLDLMRERVGDFADDRIRPYVLRPVAVDMHVR